MPEAASRAREYSSPLVFAPWCNWQHASLWNWNLGFESLGRSSIRSRDDHVSMAKSESVQMLSASRKRLLVARMLDEGLSQAEVGRRLGLAKPTVSYHARRLGIPAKDACARRYDWAEIQRAYDSGLSMCACMRDFGFSTCAWREAVKRGAIKPRPRRIPIEKLLVAGRPQTSRSHLKQRLLDEGIRMLSVQTLC